MKKYVLKEWFVLDATGKNINGGEWATQRA